MDDLKARFEKCFNIPLPAELIPDQKDTPFQRIGSCLYATDTASFDIANGGAKEFIESKKDSLYCIGFRKDGTNSEWFYYSIIDSRRKILFQLPYGGIYYDNNKLAEQIRQFLLNYIEFENQIKDKVKHITLIEGIHGEYYELIDKEGKAHESSTLSGTKQKRLFENPEFIKEFCFLWKDDHRVTINGLLLPTYSGFGIAGFYGLNHGIQSLNNRLTLNPKDIEAVIKIANIAIQIKNYDNALDMLLRGLDLDETNPALRFLTAKLRLLAPELIKSRSDEFYNYAEELQEKGEDSEATHFLALAIAIDHENIRLYLKRGSIFAENQGAYDAAVSDFTKAIELDPGFAPAYNNRGNAYHAQGNYHLAIRDYDSSIALDPKDAYNLCNRANAHIFNTDFGKAIEDYKTAIRLKPKEANFYILAARAYSLSGKILDALEILRKGLKKNPGNDQILKELKNFEENAKPTSSTTDVGDANKPGTAVWHFYRGVKLQDESKLLEAIAEYDSAIALHEKYIDAYFNKGACHAGLEDYKSAVKDFSAVLKLNPNDADAYFNLAMAYLDSNEPSKAKETLLDGLVVNPNHEGIRVELDKLR